MLRSAIGSSSSSLFSPKRKSDNDTISNLEPPTKRLKTEYKFSHYGTTTSDAQPKLEKYEFEDGSMAPINIQPYRKGAHYYVARENGSEARVFSRNAVNKNKLYFKDGEIVPADANILSVKYKYFVVNTDGSKRQVYNKAALKRLEREITFYTNDGIKLPKNTKAIKHGKQYFITPENEKTVQVFTADPLKTRRLYFLNGMEIPDYSGLKHEGKKHFYLSEDGVKTQVFLKSRLYYKKKTKNKPDSNEKLQSEKNTISSATQSPSLLFYHQENSSDADDLFINSLASGRPYHVGSSSWRR